MAATVPKAVVVEGRRQPKQQRSRAKVDALLDAADVLVVSDGLDALSTTLIASRAGVAVGSLYQYFDGVQAVVDALVERHADGFTAQLRSALERQRFTRKRDAANASLDALIDYARDHPSFPVLWRATPSSAGARIAETEDVLVDIISTVLLDQDLVRPGDAAFELEARVQWAVADALIRLAFRLDPDGDPKVLAHLRRLFELDVEAVATSP